MYYVYAFGNLVHESIEVCYEDNCVLEKLESHELFFFFESHLNVNKIEELVAWLANAYYVQKEEEVTLQE